MGSRIIIFFGLFLLCLSGCNSNGTEGGPREVSFKLTARGSFFGGLNPFDPNESQSNLKFQEFEDPFEPCSMVCSADLTREDGALIFKHDKFLNIDGGCNSDGPQKGTELLVLEGQGVEATLNPGEVLKLQLQCIEPGEGFLGVGSGFAGITNFTPISNKLNEFTLNMEISGVEISELLCGTVSAVIPSIYFTVCGIPIAGDFFQTQKTGLFGGFCALGFDGALELAQDLANCPRCGNGLLEPQFDEQCEVGVNEATCGDNQICNFCICECPSFISCDGARSVVEDTGEGCGNDLDLCCELIVGPGSTCDKMPLQGDELSLGCCTQPEITGRNCGDGIVQAPIEDCDPNADPLDPNAFCPPEECDFECFCFVPVPDPVPI